MNENMHNLPADPAVLPVMVFDIGQVLVHWDVYRIYQEPFNGDRDGITRFLQEIDYVSWNIIQDAGRPFDEGVAALSREFPHHAGLIERYDTHWSLGIGGGPVKPVVDLAERLHRAGYPLFALSNFSREKYDLMRPDFPFLDWFDGIILSGDLGLNKPDPRIYLALLARTGRPAADHIFIDDTPANIEAAQQMGLRGIVFRGDYPALCAALQEMGVPC